MQYNLTVSEEQAKIIKSALEEYFRLRLNQFFDFATDVSRDGYIYDKDDPENSKKFEAYICRRDSALDAFTKAMQIAQPIHIPQTKEMLRAQDVWQVIRHRLYLERGGDINASCTDARAPISLTGEELPTMEKTGG